MDNDVEMDNGNGNKIGRGENFKVQEENTLGNQICNARMVSKGW